MPNGELRESDIKALAIANLISQGKSEKAISKLLGHTAGHITRLKDRAVERGWLKTVEKFVCVIPEHLTEKEKHRIRNYAFTGHETVLNYLRILGRNADGVELKSLQILFTGDNAQNEEDRIKLFGKMPGDSLIELLNHNCSICATAWGRTVKAAIDGLQGYNVPSCHGMKIIPVSGEPVNFRDMEHSATASQSAAALAKLFGCECLSLQGLPARIPIKFSDSEAMTIRNFLSVSDAYKSIFSSPKPLIKELKAIITGAGDVTSSVNDPWFRETENAEGCKLGGITVGNIAGVWIESDPSDPSDTNSKDQVEGINQRWLGVQKDDILSCARRASPGVILLATGEQKAKIVMKSMGMVNHLFIDKPLGQAIYDAAKKAGFADQQG